MTVRPLSAEPIPIAERRRRLLRLAGALTGAAVASARLPLSGARGRRRLAVCSAARVLCALGVRVQVHSAAVASSAGAWPCTGVLVAANRVSFLDDLALLTVVPAAPVLPAAALARPVAGALARGVGAVPLPPGAVAPGTVAAVVDRLRSGTSVTVRPEGRRAPGELGRFRPGVFQAAVDAEVPVCPVAVLHRVGGALRGAPRTGWRELLAVLATRDLVVQVHLLPALAPRHAGAAELASLAEYAVAAVLELDRPGPVRVPSPPRRGRRPRVSRTA